MTEKRHLAILVVITFAISLAVVGLTSLIPPPIEGDLVIDEYEASFSENGSLVESYTYEVKNSGQYRMLFRYWEEELSLTNLDRPYIEFLNMTIPSGSIGYIKDNNGEVTLFGSSDPSIRWTIQSLAFNNEVGIFDPGYFQAGTYSVEYSYTLHPTIEYDDQYAHLNIRLLDEHIPFRTLVIE